jgi:hypothetical protein
VAGAATHGFADPSAIEELDRSRGSRHPTTAPTASMGTVNSLSTISCEGLRSPWRGEGSTAIRTRGASIRVLVRGQQISEEAADQEGAHPLADEGDRNSPLKAKASAVPQEIGPF